MTQNTKVKKAIEVLKDEVLRTVKEKGKKGISVTDIKEEMDIPIPYWEGHRTGGNSLVWSILAILNDNNDNGKKIEMRNGLVYIHKP